MLEATSSVTAEAARIGGSTAPGRPTGTIVWVGRVMSTLAVLPMLPSAAMKLSHAPQVVEGWAKSGYPAGSLTPIGLLELLCVVLYVVPRTAVLGAILTSCYLAAAFSSHLQMSDPKGAIPILLGVFAWGGLFLRDARIRALIPLRRPE